MRVVAEFPHPVYKITLFKSGHRLILKLDAGDLDQSYKFNDGEAGIENIRLMLQTSFLNQVEDIFAQMRALRSREINPESKTDEWDEII